LTTVLSRPGTAVLEALSRAYRCAVRARVEVVGTDLLLYYAARQMREFPVRLPMAGQAEFRAISTGGRGAFDPSPPPPSRSTPEFDAEVAAETTMLLRLAAHQGTMPGRDPAEFSSAVRHAVYETIHEASRAGLATVGVLRLLLAVLALGASPATQRLAQWDPARHDLLPDLLRADREFRWDGDYRRDGSPRYPRVETLRRQETLPGWTENSLPRLERVVLRQLNSLVRRRYRRAGTHYGHLLPWEIEDDAVIQAVRLARPCVTSAEVLLSVLDLHEQISADGLRLNQYRLGRYNQAGDVLQSGGVDYRSALAAAAEQETAAGEDDLSDFSPRAWPRRAQAKPPFFGRSALAAFRAASLEGHRAGHPYVGTTHLLIALLADDTGPAARLLRDLGADPKAIRPTAADRL
jgi:hypothetical protein